MKMLLYLFGSNKKGVILQVMSVQSIIGLTD